tara:strand:- start:397035 stop:397751 length:717 start_codon:yes stop_codon:yes gene_type:complete
MAIIITVTTNTTQPKTSLTTPELPAPPAMCRIGVAILGILVALSTLPWLYYTLGHFGGFAWGFFGFELITVLAGVYAVLLGLGKFKQGWAIGVTAIAGSILVALVFGLYVDFIMARKTDFPSLYPLAKNTLIARAAIIAALFTLASIAVFARNSKSVVYIVKAAACALPIVVVAGIMRADIGPGAAINNALEAGSGSGALQAVVGLALGLFFIVLISAAGHLMIRAYESGRPTPSKAQ